MSVRVRGLPFKNVNFISVVNYVLVFHNKQLRSGLLPTFVSVNYLMEYNIHILVRVSHLK